MFRKAGLQNKSFDLMENDLKILLAFLWQRYSYHPYKNSDALIY